MTHEELVNRAVWWLSESQGCQIVLAEQGGGLTGELADAIGWHNHESILVECKVSISDLRADFKKPWRVYPDLGIGSFRWYMVPKELEDDARRVLREPFKSGESSFQYEYRWGLLVCHPSQIRISEKPDEWHSKWEARIGRLSALGKEYETAMLLSMLSRIAAKIGTITMAEWLRKNPAEMLADLGVQIKREEVSQ